jgi:hypothetical protein
VNDSEIASEYLNNLVADMEAAGMAPDIERPANFGITTKEYMEAKDCTVAVARKMLESAVKRGVLVAHRMYVGMGTHPIVFCRPQEWPPK